MTSRPQPQQGEELWFAVQVRAGRERSSARHLRVRGYETFLPCYVERRMWSDRVRLMERALFEGYLFCRLSARVFAQIVTAPGVIRIVGDGHRPQPVTAGEIQSLQRIVTADVPRGPCPFFDVGERVRIEAGPLKGVEGVVAVVKNARRLIVSVSLLQRSVAVEMEDEWLTSCSDVRWPMQVIAG